MEKKNRNNWIRCGIFLVILALLMWYVLEVFTLSVKDENRMILTAFYNEKENSLDGVYFGASSGTRLWNGPLAFEEEGLAIGSMATQSQPLVVTKHLMEEAEKTQNPKLFIVELRWAYKDANFIEDAFIRRTVDCMKLSKTRNEAIESAVEFALKGDDPDVSTSMIDYYLPIMKYHDAWAGGIKEEDILLREPQNETKGYLVNGNTVKLEPQPTAQYTDEMEPMAVETEEMILDLLDYCDSIEPDVLFVMAPYSALEEELKRLNEAERLVEARGYPVLNFNTPEMAEAIGLDFSTDFYDSKHTNCIGAEKYTDYLAAYIAENYDIEDHRGDPAYDSWHDSYEIYVDYTAEMKASVLGSDKE